MNSDTAERLLYVDATLTEMAQLATRGRDAYESDIAVKRACQYNIIRLAADLERLGDEWLRAHPPVPWRLIKGMRNRIARNYWTVNDDIVWAVIDHHAAELHRTLKAEIHAARSNLEGTTGPLT
jgi:uncharacterized protein with HEPN domain